MGVLKMMKKKAKFRDELPEGFGAVRSVARFALRRKTTRYVTKRCNITSRYFDDKMVEMLKEQFDEIDEDGSGFLDHEELKKLWHNLGFNLSDGEVAEMIQKVD